MMNIVCVFEKDNVCVDAIILTGRRKTAISLIEREMIVIARNRGYEGYMFVVVSDDGKIRSRSTRRYV